MDTDFRKFLEHVENGLSAEDSAALTCGVLPAEFEGWLETFENGRRELVKAEAKFRLRMTTVMVDAAEIKRSVTAAAHFLKRKEPNRAQMSIDFSGSGPAKLVLEMPDNGRGPIQD